MLNLSKPTAIREVLESFDAREVVTTQYGSAQIERFPEEIRKRAFFSATIESGHFLSEARQAIADNLALNSSGNFDRSSFVANLQELADKLGIRPDDGRRGTLQDIGTRRRLELIFDMQTKMALNEGRHKIEQGDPDRLFAAPAQELVRIEERREPRDWPERWRNAGGTFFDGRMIARKDDPIWSSISRFGTPYPPFDYNSGMGLRNIRRREAVELGLVNRGEDLQQPQAEELKPAPEVRAFEDDEEIIAAIEDHFGGKVEIRPRPLKGGVEIVLKDF